MRMTRRTLLVLSPIFTLAMGCAQPYPTTPGAVVKAALAAANDKKFDEAKRYLATEGLMLFGKKMPSAREVATPAFWREFTQNRRIKDVTVTHEKENGQMAEVVTRITYEDGRTMKAEFVLMKEKPGWMMTTMFTTEKGWR